jgi:tRNA(Arg) A34 adenosine deaminase TadA
VYQQFALTCALSTTLVLVVYQESTTGATVTEHMRNVRRYLTHAIEHARPDVEFASVHERTIGVLLTTTNPCQMCTQAAAPLILSLARVVDARSLASSAC